MKSYKKWSKEERLKSLKNTNEAKRRGLLPPPTKCNRCTQTKGILHLHNDDYDWTLKELPKYLSGEKVIDEEAKKLIAECCEPICWTCHMIHHSVYRNPSAHKDYFARVVKGFIGKPVYRHDFGALTKYGF